MNRLIGGVRRRATNAWPGKLIRNRLSTPVASITFDDFPHSAWTVGGSILERAGARGTYYVSQAFSPKNQQIASGIVKGVQYYEIDDIVHANRQGHEIGCHTFDHINVPSMTNNDIEQSIMRNAKFVNDLLNDDIKMTSFAFPQGQATIRTKRLISKHFATCRGTEPGINSGMIDFSQLKCIEVLPSVFEKYPIAQHIDDAKSNNAWLIFTTHDVADSPSPWGCTPALLQTVVSELSANGIEILPIKSAVSRVVFPEKFKH